MRDAVTPENFKNDKIFSKNYCRLTLCLLLATGFTEGALAQNADNGLDEIVVTAEKRGSTIQRTPMSITAVSGDQLAAEGITDIATFIHEVPGVSVKSGGPGQTEFEMRGLSSTGGAAPTVGFYLDELALTPAAASLNGKVVLDPDLYDLARVEVLRGPQGTLYGSGSMGGTIRLITTPPDLHSFSGSVEIDGSGTPGGGPNGGVNAAVNIPIVDDKVALRLVGSEKYVSGWIDRVYENPFPYPTNNGCTPTSFYGCARGDVLNSPVTKRYDDVNWEILQGARAELLIAPTDGLKITTNAMFQTIRQGGPNTFDGPPGVVNGVEAHYQASDASEPFSDKFVMVSNSVSYDFAHMQLTASTGYWERYQVQAQETAESYQNLYSLGSFDTTPDQVNIEHDKSHQISEEVRLASNDDGPLKWIGGLYYAKLYSNYLDHSVSPSLCFLSVGGCAANPTGVVYNTYNPYRIDQYAAFGEATYDLPYDLSFTAGLRYFNFQNQVDFAQVGFFTQSGNLGVTSGSIKSTNTGVNPKFNLSYIPSDQLTVYGTVAEGFRPGGVNLPLPVSGPNTCTPYLNAIGLTQAPLTYQPDSVWNYELGEKARLLDNHLSINGDFYYMTWHNVQEPLTLACGYPYTNNAGDAASYGPELEVNYAITSEWRVGFNGTYTHATLTKAAPNTGLSDGMRITSVPQYTESASLDYVHPLNEDWMFLARLSNTLVGRTEDTAFARTSLPSYDILNLRAQLDRGNRSIAFYVNNLTDTRAEISASNTNESFNSPSLTRYSTNQPRTIGVDLRTQF